jgi:phosphoglycerate dehydrogenase-like enzyme
VTLNLNERILKLWRSTRPFAIKVGESNFFTASGVAGRMKGRRIRMERTLITGGAGFLGSHLCDFFMGLGHEVICMDNLIKKENVENITHLIGHARFKFIKYDVTE